MAHFKGSDDPNLMRKKVEQQCEEIVMVTSQGMKGITWPEKPVKG